MLTLQHRQDHSGVTMDVSHGLTGSVSHCTSEQCSTERGANVRCTPLQPFHETLLLRAKWRAGESCQALRNSATAVNHRHATINIRHYCSSVIGLDQDKAVWRKATNPRSGRTTVRITVGGIWSLTNTSRSVWWNQRDALFIQFIKN
jgi:hypothetical protein